MAFPEYAFVLSLYFVFLTFLISVYKFKVQRTAIPTNWPIFGMIPGAIVNSHRLHDYITELLARSGGTFMFKGPWFTNMDMLLTTDPLDNHHILSKNFKNYPKGENFHKIFDVMGKGILTSDGEIWAMNHKVVMHVLNHAEFQTALETIVWNKLESGLLPILESVSGNGVEMDLQDIFQRFTFDTICTLLFDNDPKSLCLDFPFAPCVKALRDAEEALLLRHITPPSLWKLQQLLRVGKENKLINATKTLDQFIYKAIDQKQNEYNNTEHQENKFIFITSFLTAFRNHNGTSLNPTKFLRDNILSLMAAGKDTTSSALSWFFYLLSRNPVAEEKILNEIRSHLEVKAGERWHVKELDEMTYFHGALCESLRLFPSVPLNHKSPLQPDILPSGHQVFPNTKIILSYYSMGRMKSIWGEDCMEFKPERWILKNGGIKREPSYKFASFGSGPRACVGKNMALSHLKIVSTMIIYHYHIELVECHPVLPQDSVVLQMKHGLKVRLTKRSELKKYPSE